MAQWQCLNFDTRLLHLKKTDSWNLCVSRFGSFTRMIQTFNDCCEYYYLDETTKLMTIDANTPLPFVVQGVKRQTQCPEDDAYKTWLVTHQYTKVYNSNKWFTTKRLSLPRQQVARAGIQTSPLWPFLLSFSTFCSTHSYTSYFYQILHLCIIIIKNAHPFVHTTAGCNRGVRIV